MKYKNTSTGSMLAKTEVKKKHRQLFQLLHSFIFVKSIPLIIFVFFFIGGSCRQIKYFFTENTGENLTVEETTHFPAN